MELGVHSIGTRSAGAVFDAVQRTFSHHGVPRFTNGRHTSYAPRHRSRAVRGGTVALRWLARPGELDVWRRVDCAVEQRSFQRGTPEHAWRLAGYPFDACGDWMDPDFEAPHAAAFTG